MMMNIIYCIKISHIVLSKILYINMGVWYYFNMWKGYNCREIGTHRGVSRDKCFSRWCGWDVKMSRAILAQVTVVKNSHPPTPCIIAEVVMHPLKVDSNSEVQWKSLAPTNGPNMRHNAPTTTPKKYCLFVGGWWQMQTLVVLKFLRSLRSSTPSGRMVLWY